MTNVVVLHGRLSRPVGERELPSGDRLATFDLTVPSSEPDRRAESVPLVWFDAPGWVADLDMGVELVVLGRVRRRFFRGEGGPQSRTEVVIDAAAPARRAARTAELFRQAIGALTDASAAYAGTGTEPRGGGRRRAAPAFP